MIYQRKFIEVLAFKLPQDTVLMARKCVVRVPQGWFTEEKYYYTHPRLKSDETGP
jgi:hypothetical protein